MSLSLRNRSFWRRILGLSSVTFCVICKGIPSATPENIDTQRQISVDKMCYGLARIGRQKALVNRKYGHDTQGVRVLHTPGRSPDSICLLDEKNGLLFGGDTINTGPIYAQLEDSDVAAFARSTAAPCSARRLGLQGLCVPLHAA